MPWHRKKEKIDRSWWEHKGLLKDRRKTYFGAHWKRSLKKEEKRTRRAFERRMIADENWEALRSSHPNWHHADRWTYD
jgi:hypothetical protein